MKKTLSSSKTLSRSIVAPFKSLENRLDTTTLSENICDDTIRRMQMEVDMLRREFLLEREQRAADSVTVHQRIADISKENIQRFEALREIFSDIESNLNERLIEREKKI